MAFIEQIVRPFQSPGIINDKKTRTTRVIKVSTERAIIRWGSAGDSPETKQVGVKVTVKGQDVKKAYTQKEVKTTDIRVENPDDKNQYIIDRRIDQIAFSRPKPFSDNRTGQPTNVPPGQQDPVVAASSSTTTKSSGTTITKTESGLTTQYVNGNSNVTETSNAGTTVTAAAKRTEVDTFILDWSKIT